MREAQIYMKKHEKTLKYRRKGGGCRPQLSFFYPSPPKGCKNITENV